MSGPTLSTAVLPSPISRIILTGFMGAGKSTVGALLAERLGWRFLDSDRLIETHAGRTIAAIFAEQGEPAFRELEAAVIRESAAAPHLVLALGGGAVETSATRDFLSTLPDTVIVYLDAPLDVLVSRCARHEEGPVRPVLADHARLEERWLHRQTWYRQAHLTIATSCLPPQAVVEAILQQLAASPHFTRAGAPA